MFINWALGFRACGCEVYWLDVVPPNTSPEELQDAIHRLKTSLKPFGLDRLILVDYLSDEVGISAISTADNFGDFDLLFDLRYNLPSRLRKRARRSAFLDMDPGQLQIALATGVYPDPKHDLFFSIGSAGTPMARFPDVGKTWIHTHPCVYLPEWPVYPAPPNAAWTTVAHWWGEGGLDEAGEFPNSKRDGFAPLMDIPSVVLAPFKLALDPYCDQRRIEDCGFEVVNAHNVAATPLDYRDFIQQSLGEFSAAKPSYVRQRTAWISDRTVCYLASGKPCVVENTGPIQSLECFDEGLHRFTDRSGAVRALERVMANYEAETLSARAIAEACFDARKVCHRILTLAL